MNKFIIDNRTELSDLEIFSMLLQVIKAGKLSNKDRQYAYLTTFYDHTKTEEYHIVSQLNEKSEKFIIHKVE